MRSCLSEVLSLQNQLSKEEVVPQEEKNMQSVQPSYVKYTINYAKQAGTDQSVSVCMESMKKGYIEMSKINLAIASECCHLEYEAQRTVERQVIGG